MKKNINLHAALGIPALPQNNATTFSALLWAREVLQKHLAITYSVSDPKGIEELKSVKIGGVEQWLHIRSRNRKNPILFFIHGGQGSPMIGFMDAIQRPWEDYFTVVHWDQRQTGKSYYPANDENAPLTIKQFISDTEEVIQYLRDYLEKDKLFIVGHSWGTVLGMHMVKRHPEWIYAYVGIGQVVSMAAGELVLYERLLSHAKDKNRADLVLKLEKIIPLLDTEYPIREKCFVDNCSFVRRELSHIAGESLMHHNLWDDVLPVLALDRAISPHLTLTDLSHSIAGDDPAWSRPPYTFTKEFLSINLPNDLGNSFDIPIFFFSGVHDWQTPVSLSDEWFSQINTTHKELLHFQESSHFIFNEEPGKVLMALVNQVLPYALHHTAG